MIVGILILALLVMRLWPETPLARTLRALLVDGPSRWLDRPRLLWLLVIIGLMAAAMAMLPLIPGETALILGIDWALYADLITAALVIGTQLRWRQVRQSFVTLRHWVAARLPRPRAKRAVRVRRHRPPRADDDRPAVWALA